MKIEKKINLFKQNIPETTKKKNVVICEKIKSKVFPLLLDSTILLFSDYCPRVKTRTYHFVFFDSERERLVRDIGIFSGFLTANNIIGEAQNTLAESNDKSVWLSETEFKKLKTLLEKGFEE